MPYDVSDSDRNSIRKMREYEHRFYKSSDNGKSISPKVSINKERLIDFIQTNTGYYSRHMSPEVKKQKEFSPVLKRRRSNIEFEQLDLFQVFHNYKKIK